MNRTNLRTIIFVSFLSVLMLSLCNRSVSAQDTSQTDKDKDKTTTGRTFTVDVALGTPYSQNNVNPAVTDPSAFSPGDTFIQDGNIYPANTIPGGKTTFDPKTPGAIGKYRARGTFTTDLANFLRAVEHDTHADSDLAFATEMYTFLSDKSILMTDGTWPNAHFSANRVVLGGTGRFRNVVGEVHVENIGENKETLFCNFRVTFKLRQVDGGQGR